MSDIILVLYILAVLIVVFVGFIFLLPYDMKIKDNIKEYLKEKYNLKQTKIIRKWVNRIGSALCLVAWLWLSLYKLIYLDIDLFSFVWILFGFWIVGKWTLNSWKSIF